MTTRRTYEAHTLELIAASAVAGISTTITVAALWYRQLVLALVAAALVVISLWLVDRLENGLLERVFRDRK